MGFLDCAEKLNLPGMEKRRRRCQRAKAEKKIRKPPAKSRLAPSELDWYAKKKNEKENKKNTEGTSGNKKEFKLYDVIAYIKM